nr:Fic family protein [Nitrosomonas nitrosa]
MSDPNVYPGTDVFINKRNIHDADKLERFECLMSTKRMEEALPPVPMSYEGYKAIHRHMFQDVYHWEGEARTVSLAKDDTFFGPPDHVDTEMQKRFEVIARGSKLKGMRRAGFAKHAAEHIEEISAIHPLREGNGRAQRQFLKLLAQQAGHKLDLKRIMPEAWHHASVQGFHGKHDAMEKVIRSAIVERPRIKTRSRDEGRER